jgi:dihydrofolate reductase
MTSMLRGRGRAHQFSLLTILVARRVCFSWTAQQTITRRFASTTTPVLAMVPKGLVFIATTLDGKIARSDGSVDFLDEYQNSASNDDNDATDDMGFASFLDSVDALVMGRNSFDKVVSFGEGMWAYKLKPIYVWTRNVDSVSIPNWLQVIGTISPTSLAPRDLFDELGRMGKKNVYVDGGTTVREFLDAGLIQAMTISVVPLILGQGIPLFLDQPSAKTIPLRYVQTKVYENGITQSRYEVLL